MANYTEYKAPEIAIYQIEVEQGFQISNPYPDGFAEPLSATSYMDDEY